MACINARVERAPGILWAGVAGCTGVVDPRVSVTAILWTGVFTARIQITAVVGFSARIDDDTCIPASAIPRSPVRPPPINRMNDRS
jgi:hypothetical protein